MMAGGEVNDVRTALAWLAHEFHLPLIFAGFSFGAAVGLQAACPDARVKAVMALGLPVTAVVNRAHDFCFFQNCAKTKLLVSGGGGQFGPPAQLQGVCVSFSPPPEVVLIERAG